MDAEQQGFKTHARRSRCGAPRTASWAALAASVVALLPACGSVGDDSATKTGASADSGGLRTVFDIAADVGGDGSQADAVDPDAAVDAPSPDVATDAAPPTQCEFAASPGPGEPGAACSANPDCDSGVCVKTLAGGRCSRTCTDCCPGGWACAQVPGRDALYVCLPRLEALCLPCQSDNDCAARNAGALCLGYDAGDGELVRFCGGACDKDNDCPDGYACQDAKGSAGQAKQCVRSAGLCPCGAVAVAEGLVAACSVQGAAGTCAGTRACGADGLAACSAAAPAPEACNGADDDCDGSTDEDVSTKPCDITNEHGVCAGTAPCTQGAAVCDAKTPAAESCNGADDDCDGKTDEGCDDDKDGYCAAGMAIADLPPACSEPGGCGTAPMPPWCSKGIGDCADQAVEVHPGTSESCGNAIDDDCDGQTDAPSTAAAAAPPTGCKLWYADADQDGAGDANQSACLCAANATFPAADGKDCDDKDAAVKPGATEICGNAKDDDCDGSQNQEGAKDCTNFYVDKDGDGFGAGAALCLCAASGGHNVAVAGDCDDSKKGVAPDAAEGCDGMVDEDCDGKTDEEGAQGCKAWYVDSDKDGWGDASKSACLCGAAGAFATLQAGDCNEGNPTVHAGASELCNDSADNDCDGSTDEEGAKNCTDWHLDADQDGYGSKTEKKCLCDKGDVKGYTSSKGTDCNDKDAGVSPEAKEICDGQDNDCDNGVDTGCDADGDGYCDGSKATVGKPAACPKGGGDCNDDAKAGGAAIHPGAVEVCNGKDDNCGLGADEGCDDDGDGYCDKAKSVVGTPAVCAKGGGDCDDGDKAVSPGATEICNDKDDDCGDGVDEGCDDDNDGYCDKAMTLVGTPKTCASGGGDCCDLDATARPGQAGWYTAANKCGSYDYDCSGSAEKQWTVLAQAKHICEGFACTTKAECVADPQGWQSGAPACGSSGTWIVDYQWDGSLTLPLVNTCKSSVTSQKTQGCH